MRLAKRVLPIIMAAVMAAGYRAVHSGLETLRQRQQAARQKRPFHRQALPVRTQGKKRERRPPQNGRSQIWRGAK